MIKKPKKRKKTERQKLIAELDRLCNLAVCKRDDYTCVKCKRRRKGGSWSHFWSRRYKATRWMLCNVYYMDWGCHQLVEKEKQGWFSDFMVEKLGLDGYEWLENEAHSYKKWTIDELKDMIEDFKSQL